MAKSEKFVYVRPDLHFSVETEIREMSRDLKKIKEAIPRITYKALNELTYWAREEISSGAASKLKIPEYKLRFLTAKGIARSRFLLTEARESHLRAEIRGNAEGIQVTDLALGALSPWNVKGASHKVRGGGVLAIGGRFYKGAFLARPNGRGKMRVFHRRSEAAASEGHGKHGRRKGRYPVGLVRVPVVKAMDDQFHGIVDSGRGSFKFKQRFSEIANQELLRAGFR